MARSKFRRRSGKNKKGKRIRKGGSMTNFGGKTPYKKNNKLFSKSHKQRKRKLTLLSGLSRKDLFG